MPDTERIKNLVGRNFRPIWERADRKSAFTLCNRIRNQMGWEPLDYATFDKAYQWRNIFSADYESAKDEFTNVILGWW